MHNLLLWLLRIIIQKVNRIENFPCGAYNLNPMECKKDHMSDAGMWTEQAVQIDYCSSLISNYILWLISRVTRKDQKTKISLLLQYDLF